MIDYIRELEAKVCSLEGLVSSQHCTIAILMATVENYKSSFSTSSGASVSDVDLERLQRKVEALENQSEMSAMRIADLCSRVFLSVEASVEKMSEKLR